MTDEEDKYIHDIHTVQRNLKTMYTCYDKMCTTVHTCSFMNFLSCIYNFSRYKNDINKLYEKIKIYNFTLTYS